MNNNTDLSNIGFNAREILDLPSDSSTSSFFNTLEPLSITASTQAPSTTESGAARADQRRPSGNAAIGNPFASHPWAEASLSPLRSSWATAHPLMRESGGDHQANPYNASDSSEDDDDFVNSFFRSEHLSEALVDPPSKRLKRESSAESNSAENNPIVKTIARATLIRQKQIAYDQLGSCIVERARTYFAKPNDALFDFAGAAHEEQVNSDHWQINRDANPLMWSITSETTPSEAIIDIMEDNSHFTQWTAPMPEPYLSYKVF